MDCSQKYFQNEGLQTIEKPRFSKKKKRFWQTKQSREIVTTEHMSNISQKGVSYQSHTTFKKFEGLAAKKKYFEVKCLGNTKTCTIFQIVSRKSLGKHFPWETEKYTNYQFMSFPYAMTDWGFVPGLAATTKHRNLTENVEEARSSQLKSSIKELSISVMGLQR